MHWRCYAWTGPNPPTEAERADQDSATPGIHPRDWLIKPARYELYEDGPSAVGWFRDLMSRARIHGGRFLIDVASDNIMHGIDVSQWLQLPDGGWLSFAVLTVDGSPNGHASLAGE